MSDIGLGLLEAIEHDFTSLLEEDTIASRLLDSIKKGTATFAEAEEYAARIGELLSKAITTQCDILLPPNSPLTVEILEEFLLPMLNEGYLKVTDAAAKTMEALCKAAGLKMTSAKPVIDKNRITGLINKAASYDTYEDARWLFEDPVVNFSQNVCDRLIQNNVDVHHDIGLLPKVTRKAMGKCCKWCSALEGEYVYPVEREVYQRHENCRCLVLYDPGNGKIQNAHTKKVYDDVKTAERESRIERAKEIEEKQNAMYHRRIGKRNREVIDQPTYNKLTRDYLRRGGTIERGPRAEAWLNQSGHGASYIMGGNHTFFRDDATISEVLEEMFHAMQDRTGRFSNYPEDEIKLRREIEAQHYVMSLQKRYKIPELEMEELRTNLADYERDLEELLRQKNENY